MRFDKTLGVKSHTQLLVKGIQAVKFSSGEKMIGTIRSSALANEIAEDLDKGPIIYVRNFKGYSIAILPDHVHVFRFDKEVTKEEAEKVVEELEKILR